MEKEKGSNDASVGRSGDIPAATAPNMGVSSGAAACDRCSSVPQWQTQTPLISSPIVPTLPESVYEPAEDTYLFMDVLEREILSSRSSPVGRVGDPAGHMAALRRPMLGLEMGCGSGSLSAFALKAVAAASGSCGGEGVSSSSSSPPPLFLLCVDINRDASIAARETLSTNGCASHADVVVGDLFSSFRPDPLFDFVIFNPPYVPTPAAELQAAAKACVLVGSRDAKTEGGSDTCPTGRALPTYAGVSASPIAASWAGGPRGRTVIDAFVRCLPVYVSPESVTYLLLEERNFPDEVQRNAAAVGLCCALVSPPRRARNERLSVWRLTPTLAVPLTHDG